MNSFCSATCKGSGISHTFGLLPFQRYGGGRYGYIDLTLPLFIGEFSTNVCLFYHSHLPPSFGTTILYHSHSTPPFITTTAIYQPSFDTII